MTPKNCSVITIERFLIQNFANYRTMAEIQTDKHSLPKSPTQLEKVGPSFSSFFSLARACVLGDIAPLKMLWGTGNPHTSCIILGNAVNTRDNNLFDEWEMKTRYTCQSFFCFCSQFLEKGIMCQCCFMYQLNTINFL